MDIRNFFAAAGTANSKKKKKAQVGVDTTTDDGDGGGNSNRGKSNSKSKSSSSSAASQSKSSNNSSKSKKSPLKSTTNKTKKKQQQQPVIDESDSDTDVSDNNKDDAGVNDDRKNNEPPAKAGASPKKRKVYIDSSDSDDNGWQDDSDFEDAKDTKKGGGGKNKTTTTTSSKNSKTKSSPSTSRTAAAKEMSPEEFFGGGGSKSKSPTKSSSSTAKPSPNKKPKLSSSSAKSSNRKGKNDDDDSDYSADMTKDGEPNHDSPASEEEDVRGDSISKRKTPPRSASSSRKKRIQSYAEDDSDDDFKVESSDEDEDESSDEDFGSKSKTKKSKSPAKKVKTPSPKKVKSSSPSPSKRLKKEPPAASTPASSSTPTKKKTTPAKKTTSARKKSSPAASTAKPPQIEVLEPTLERDSFDVDTEAIVPECLAGLTFVFTGELDTLSKLDSSDLIKTLGGRVTGAVSSKTTYLVVGEYLEDGRYHTEGSKYRKATGELKDKVKIVMGEKRLYGLIKLYQDKAIKEKGVPAPVQQPPLTTTNNPTTVSNPYTNNNKPPVTNPYAKAQPVANPYAKAQPVGNPYAKSAATTNPYAKSASSATNPYSKDAPSNPYASSGAGTATQQSKSAGQSNELWVDRHKPTTTHQILGNKSNVGKLETWLKNWERTFVNNPKNPHGKSYSNPKGPWKAALLSGPPGIGKTTTATLVSKEAGRDVLEFNASDARSKKTLQQTLGSSIDSQGLAFAPKKSGKAKVPSTRKVIIMDEVDGMGAGDRSGMAELIQMIKRSKTPIICICNDRQSQKIKSLLPYCMDLRFSRPTKNVLANRAMRIAKDEGLIVERNAAEAIAESCGNDVRQVLNLLQMWSQKKDGSNSLTYKGLKDREKTINKDEILRVSLFDAAKVLLEGRRDLSHADAKANVASLNKRTDAFFVDYSFTGLIVQQNYTKVLNSQYLKVKHDPDAELAMLEQTHQAALTMSDYNLVESQIRGGDGNWGLLPTAATMVVKCGYHAGGETGGFFPGFPEFTTWLGKNSSTAKNYRLLNELNHHMNYNVSANSQELRQTYVPVLRDRIFRLLKDENNPSATKEAIELMDDYGLDREDVAERLEVFALGKPDHTYDDLDSKQKAAFTREYNAGKHMSQALVSEQGGGAPKKKKSGGSTKDPLDLDAIDEDGDDDNDEDDEEEEEKELEKLRKQFKKKGRKTSKAKSSKK